MTTILLIEDNPDMLKVLSLMLEESGYKVLTARGAQEAENHLQQTVYKPDVIISDLYMPQVDGMMMLKSVRTNAEFASVPFILMSAFPSDEMQRQAFENGADAFLNKPFRFDTLNGIIRNLGISSSAEV